MTAPELSLLRRDDVVAFGFDKGTRQYKSLGVVQRIVGRGVEKQVHVEWEGTTPGMSVETVQSMLDSIDFICHADSTATSRLSELLRK